MSKYFNKTQWVLFMFENSNGDSNFLRWWNIPFHIKDSTSCFWNMMNVSCTSKGKHEWTGVFSQGLGLATSNLKATSLLNKSPSSVHSPEPQTHAESCSCLQLFGEPEIFFAWYFLRVQLGVECRYLSFAVSLNCRGGDAKKRKLFQNNITNTGFQQHDLSMLQKTHDYEPMGTSWVLAMAVTIAPSWSFAGHLQTMHGTGVASSRQSFS